MLSLDELRRRDFGIGVLDEPRELVPVQSPVEPNAEPSPVSDIRRHEKPFRVGFDERLLHSVGGGAPNGEATVTVMVAQHHQERALSPDEERRRSVAEPLARFR